MPASFSPIGLPIPLDDPGLLLRLDAGRLVFRQQERVASKYWLESGEVRLVHHAGAGIVMHHALPGETLAEQTLFGDAYAVDALTHSAVQLRASPREKWLAELLQSSPQAMLRSILNHLDQVRMRLERRNIASARGRLGAWLRLRATGTPPVVDATQTWTAVAEEIGLRREVVYRALAELDRTGASDVRARLSTSRPSLHLSTRELRAQCAADDLSYARPTVGGSTRGPTA